jgi:hypothetical protein
VHILQSHEALLTEDQIAAAIAELPLLQPDLIRKREWVKKKTHDKADPRGATGTEIAGRALKAQEKKERGTCKCLNTPTQQARLCWMPPKLPPWRAALHYLCTRIACIYSTCAATTGAKSYSTNYFITPVQLLKLQVRAEEPIRYFPYTPIEADSIQLVHSQP